MATPAVPPPEAPPTPAMPARAARPRLLATLVAAGAVVLACRTLAPAFVGVPAAPAPRAHTALQATSEDSRRTAVLGFLGSAAAAVGARSAEAAGGYGEAPKISILGFSVNTDGPTSDSYSSLDKDAYSSYSDFSGGKQEDNIYQPYESEANAKLKTELEESWKRYTTDVKKELDREIPNRVRMETTRQVGVMRKNMLYFSDLPPRDLSKTKLAREFFEDVSGMLAFAERSQWGKANEFYMKSLGSLDTWKRAANF